MQQPASSSAAALGILPSYAAGPPCPAEREPPGAYLVHKVIWRSVFLGVVGGFSLFVCGCEFVICGGYEFVFSSRRLDLLAKIGVPFFC